MAKAEEDLLSRLNRFAFQEAAKPSCNVTVTLRIGDEYRDGKFYRDGDEILTDTEALYMLLGGSNT